MAYQKVFATNISKQMVRRTTMTPRIRIHIPSMPSCSTRASVATFIGRIAAKSPSSEIAQHFGRKVGGSSLEKNMV